MEERRRFLNSVQSTVKEKDYLVQEYFQPVCRLKKSCWLSVAASGARIGCKRRPTVLLALIDHQERIVSQIIGLQGKNIRILLHRKGP